MMKIVAYEGSGARLQVHLLRMPLWGRWLRWGAARLVGRFDGSGRKRGLFRVDSSDRSTSRDAVGRSVGRFNGMSRRWAWLWVDSSAASMGWDAVGRFIGRFDGMVRRWGLLRVGSSMVPMSWDADRPIRGWNRRGGR